jgi:hypothetical protein
MIQLPKRSVTRFFIPLIDVLLLLFCIFLLMPFFKGSGQTAGAETDSASAEQLRRREEAVAAREEKMSKREAELDRLRRATDAPREIREELERLRKEKIKTLQERLVIRVLEIDAGTGKLYYRDPERVEIATEAKARDLIVQDRTRQGPNKPEVYYLILYPRDPSSSYPLREQRERYDRWFSDAAHGWDTPSGPQDKGSQP